MKKNEKLRVCVYFKDLNAATPKDMCVMSIANMLVTPLQLMSYYPSWTVSLGITKS